MIPVILNGDFNKMLSLLCAVTYFGCHMPLAHGAPRRQRMIRFGVMQFLPDDDTLILSVNHHVSVHVICQSVDMRRVLILSLRDDKIM